MWARLAGIAGDEATKVVLSRGASTTMGKGTSLLCLPSLAHVDVCARKWFSKYFAVNVSLFHNARVAMLRESCYHCVSPPVVWYLRIQESEVAREEHFSEQIYMC